MMFGLLSLLKRAWRVVLILFYAIKGNSSESKSNENQEESFLKFKDISITRLDSQEVSLLLHETGPMWKIISLIKGQSREYTATLQVVFPEMEDGRPLIIEYSMNYN